MIVCRSAAELERLARVNALVARVLAELRAMVAPGVTTAEIDARAEQRLREAGAEPAFKGYNGYPSTICASVNEQVVHGFPSASELVEGDIVVGRPGRQARRLLRRQRGDRAGRAGQRRGGAAARGDARRR